MAWWQAQTAVFESTYRYWHLRFRKWSARTENQQRLYLGIVWCVIFIYQGTVVDETIAMLAEKAFRDNWFNSTYNLNISKEDLIDLLNVYTKGQLFQFNGALYEQTDGVAMGSPLRPSLANVFMSSLEEKLELEGKLPDYYRRYVDITTLPQLRTF